MEPLHISRIRSGTVSALHQGVYYFEYCGVSYVHLVVYERLLLAIMLFQDAAKGLTMKFHPDLYYLAESNKCDPACCGAP